jgi:hypothetical protein
VDVEQIDVVDAEAVETAVDRRLHVVRTRWEIHVNGFRRDEDVLAVDRRGGNPFADVLLVPVGMGRIDRSITDIERCPYVLGPLWLVVFGVGSQSDPRKIFDRHHPEFRSPIA